MYVFMINYICAFFIHICESVLLVILYYNLLYIFNVRFYLFVSILHIPVMLNVKAICLFVARYFYYEACFRNLFLRK